MSAGTTVLAYIPSPPQGVWHLGPIPLRAYALFIIVGIVVAIIWGERRWAARGGTPGTVADVAVWAVPFGLIGGRIYHVLTDAPKYFGPNGDPMAAFAVWEGGLGIWGAVIFGGVGAWIACRRRGIPLPAFGDAVAPPILLAQAIGRIGNYFNQELYGAPTDLPWGLEIFTRVNSAGRIDNLNGVSTGVVETVVHPIFLYEALWALLVVALLVIVDRRTNIGHGRLFALYVAGYCAGRFVIELMRQDEATQFFGVRINSYTSAIIFVLACAYILFAPRGREKPESLKGNAADAGVDGEPAPEVVSVGAPVGGGEARKAEGERTGDTTSSGPESSPALSSPAPSGGGIPAADTTPAAGAEKTSAATSLNTTSSDTKPSDTKSSDTTSPGGSKAESSDSGSSATDSGAAGSAD